MPQRWSRELLLSGSCPRKAFSGPGLPAGHLRVLSLSTLGGSGWQGLTWAGLSALGKSEEARLPVNTDLIDEVHLGPHVDPHAHNSADRGIHTCREGQDSG